jgi:hypothetical protein
MYAKGGNHCDTGGFRGLWTSHPHPVQNSTDQSAFLAIDLK